MILGASVSYGYRSMWSTIGVVQKGTLLSSPQLTWQEKLLNDPANMLSIGIGLIGVILGFIPLILYVFERRNNRNLSAVIKEFSLMEQIQHAREQEKSRQEAVSSQLAEVETQAEQMREEIETRLPKMALSAYYQNTIPQVEHQISELQYQLDNMRKSVNDLGLDEDVTNPILKEVLSSVISKHLTARRSLEQFQVLL